MCTLAHNSVESAVLAWIIWRMTRIPPTSTTTITAASRPLYVLGRRLLAESLARSIIIRGWSCAHANAIWALCVVSTFRGLGAALWI